MTWIGVGAAKEADVSWFGLDKTLTTETVDILDKLVEHLSGFRFVGGHVHVTVDECFAQLAVALAHQMEDLVASKTFTVVEEIG